MRRGGPSTRRCAPRSGTGPPAPQSVCTVVTGSVGPKAYKALQAAGIRIALIEAVCPGTEALRRFKDNELPVLDQPNGESHWV